MYETRVAKGATLLDKKRPGWHEEIDLHKLDMTHCHRCILGQLFNDFNAGANILGILNSEIDHGFDFDANKVSDKRYANLQKAWVAFIRGRNESIAAQVNGLSVVAQRN